MILADSLSFGSFDESHFKEANLAIAFQLTGISNRMETPAEFALDRNIISYRSTIKRQSRTTKRIHMQIKARNEPNEIEDKTCLLHSTITHTQSNQLFNSNAALIPRTQRLYTIKPWRRIFIICVICEWCE